MFDFHPYLGKWPKLTIIFFKWVVQPLEILSKWPVKFGGFCVGTIHPKISLKKKSGLMKKIPISYLDLPKRVRVMDDKGCPYTIPWIQTEPLGRSRYEYLWHPHGFLMPDLSPTEAPCTANTTGTGTRWMWEKTGSDWRIRIPSFLVTPFFKALKLVEGTPSFFCVFRLFFLHTRLFKGCQFWLKGFG